MKSIAWPPPRKMRGSLSPSQSAPGYILNMDNPTFKIVLNHHRQYLAFVEITAIFRVLFGIDFDFSLWYKQTFRNEYPNIDELWRIARNQRDECNQTEKKCAQILTVWDYISIIVKFLFYSSSYEYLYVHENIWNASLKVAVVLGRFQIGFAFQMSHRILKLCNEFNNLPKLQILQDTSIT